MANENGTWLKILLGSMITVFLGITSIQFTAIASNAKVREETDSEMKVAILQHDAKFAKLEECMHSVKEDLAEIKSILKRTSPYERENVHKQDLSNKGNPVPQTY